MEHKLLKINETDIVDFLLNPFQRTAHSGDFIVQKYPLSIGVDEFIRICINSDFLYHVGYVLYNEKKIIIKNSESKSTNLGLEITKNGPILTIFELKQEVESIINSRLESAKNNEMDELMALPSYSGFYKATKADFFDYIVCSMLGASPFSFSIRSDTAQKINKFIQSRTMSELIGIKFGKLEDVDKMIYSILRSVNFMIADIVQPGILDEASEYISSGKLTKRHAMIKDFLEKTKRSGANRFTVETVVGQKMSCKNQANYNGTLPLTNSSDEEVNIEDIKIVKYQGKILYKKTTL